MKLKKYCSSIRKNLLKRSEVWNMKPEEIVFMKSIKDQTDCPYSIIIEAMEKCGLDKTKVIDYIREHAIVLA